MSLPRRTTPMPSLRELVRRGRLPPKPTIASRTRIDDADLEAALADQVPSWGRAVERMSLDADYYTASKADWKTLVDEDPTDLLVWERDVHDCDDMAWALRNTAVNVFGLTAIGFVNDYSADHVYNCVVTDEGDVFFVEPASDDWGFQPPDAFPVDDRHQLSHADIIL